MAKKHFETWVDESTIGAFNIINLQKTSLYQDIMNLMGVCEKLKYNSVRGVQVIAQNLKEKWLYSSEQND